MRPAENRALSEKPPALAWIKQNIAKMPAHHIDLSQCDGEFHIKKGRVNSDLPFLKTKELIIFEVVHRLTKPQCNIG